MRSNAGLAARPSEPSLNGSVVRFAWLCSSRLPRSIAGTAWPHRQPSMLDDSVDGRLLGSKRAKIVQRPIGPDDLHAPDPPAWAARSWFDPRLAYFLGASAKQTNKTGEIGNGAARVVPRRPAPAFGPLALKIPG